MQGCSLIRAGVAGLLVLGSAGTAGAGELFIGAMAHNVDLPTTIGSPEGGVDVQLGLRTEPFALLGSAELRGHVFGSVNSDDGVNFAVAGINLRLPLGTAVYIQPALGVAVQDGSTADFPRTRDRLYLGSRVLFAPELALGARLSERWSAEIAWVHLSHAKLAGGQNPGLDDVGMRLIYRF